MSTAAEVEYSLAVARLQADDMAASGRTGWAKTMRALIAALEQTT